MSFGDLFSCQGTPSGPYTDGVSGCPVEPKPGCSKEPGGLNVSLGIAFGGGEEEPCGSKVPVPPVESEGLAGGLVGGLDGWIVLGCGAGGVTVLVEHPD